MNVRHEVLVSGVAAYYLGVARRKVLSPPSEPEGFVFGVRRIDRDSIPYSWVVFSRGTRVYWCTFLARLAVRLGSQAHHVATRRYDPDAIVHGILAACGEIPGNPA